MELITSVASRTNLELCRKKYLCIFNVYSIRMIFQGLSSDEEMNTTMNWT